MIILMDFPKLHRLIKRNDQHFFETSPKSSGIISLQSKCRESPLHIACRYDRENILECLITVHGADMEVSNHEGKKPLHEAAQYGSLKCLQLLLKKGALVDSLKRADWTPLMLACTKSCVNLVQALLDYGANPCLKNKDGWNSCHIACREGHMPILEALVMNSPSVWDTMSNSLRTPLHTAALHGNREVVSWLLEKCPSRVDAVDSCGVTALMDALRSGHVAEIASMLVFNYQADPTIQDQVGRQAIHHVAQAGQQRALEFLLSEAKIPVNAISESTQETALHTAAKEGQDRIVEVLISHGADINQVDSRGRTALHIASGSQSAECVGRLLRHGALVTPDDSGRMPRDLAVKQSVLDVFAESGLGNQAKED